MTGPKYDRAFVNETSSYERKTVVELRELATTRGLPFNTKTRKPELIALLQTFDSEPVATVESATMDNLTIGPGQMYFGSIPKRHGALKLDPLQMRLNYARQRTRNPNLTLAEAFNVKLTPKQHRMISRRNGLIACGKLSEFDFKVFNHGNA